MISKKWTKTLQILQDCTKKCYFQLLSYSQSVHRRVKKFEDGNQYFEVMNFKWASFGNDTWYRKNEKNLPRYYNIAPKNGISSFSAIYSQSTGLSKNLRMGTNILKLWISNEHHLVMRHDIEKMKKAFPDIIT